MPMLACLLCASTAFAVETDEAVVTTGEEAGIVADKRIPGSAVVVSAETVAGSGDEHGSGGEEAASDSQS